MESCHCFQKAFMLVEVITYINSIKSNFIVDGNQQIKFF